ncbi:hypothetical protein PybrP1_001192 [[Pythium] brassicae (nom. inval.)]|nr:hypothetical protein PybrP1_001192 [[Pythium] brassicae (nom. inval.)]
MVQSPPPPAAPTTCPLLLESRALIDALGYVDTELEAPAARAAVQQLIRAEMASFAPPSGGYLAFLPDYAPAFAGRPRLQNEFKRVAAGVALDAIDLHRYTVCAPTGKSARDAESWEAAVKQMQIQYEHQSNRVMNLELQQAYGANVWKAKAAVLDGLNAQYAHKLAATKAASEAVNVQRKQDQERNAPKLQSYSRKYLDLLDKTFSIKRACENEERRAAKKVRVES